MPTKNNPTNTVLDNLTRNYLPPLQSCSAFEIETLEAKVNELISSLLARKTVNYNFVCYLSLIQDFGISDGQISASSGNSPSETVEN